MEKVLYIKVDSSWRIWVQESNRYRLVEAVHRKLLHFGAGKIIYFLSKVFYFPNLEKMVKSFIRTCELCQKAKYFQKSTEGKAKSILARVPLEKVAVDFFGPLPTGRSGLKYIIVFMDICSKYVKLYGVKSPKTTFLIQIFRDRFLQEVGKPKIILSDHGGQFISHEWETFLTSQGVISTKTSVYHPQSNPVERVMREIGRILRTYCHDSHTNWVKWLPIMEKSINETKHSATCFSPRELLLGGNIEHKLGQFFPLLNDNMDLSKQEKILIANRNNKEVSETRNERHDLRNKNPLKLDIGDLVLVKNHKLSNADKQKIKKFFLIYDGPYKIVGIRNQNSFILENSEGEILGTRNIIYLRPFYQN